MIARSYLRLEYLWRRARLPAQAAFKGVCLGVMGRRALHAVDEAMYRERPIYHTAEHNTRGWFDWEQEALAHFPSSGRIAVIGAGGGREVLALARQGHEAVGYECNPALVATAERLLAEQALGARASVALLPRDAVPAADRPFDAVIVGWSAYMLIIGSEARIRFLRGIRQMVDPGAPVLISFFTREGDGAYLRTVARVAGPLRRLLRREPVEMGDNLSPNYVHHFTRDEVERELRAGGFRMAAFSPQGNGAYASGFAVGLAEG